MPSSCQLFPKGNHRNTHILTVHPCSSSVSCSPRETTGMLTCLQSVHAELLSAVHRTWYQDASTQRPLLYIHAGLLSAVHRTWYQDASTQRPLLYIHAELLSAVHRTWYQDASTQRPLLYIHAELLSAAPYLIGTLIFLHDIPVEFLYIVYCLPAARVVNRE